MQYPEVFRQRGKKLDILDEPGTMEETVNAWFVYHRQHKPGESCFIPGERQLHLHLKPSSISYGERPAEIFNVSLHHGDKIISSRCVAARVKDKAIDPEGFEFIQRGLDGFGLPDHPLGWMLL